MKPLTIKTDRSDLPFTGFRNFLVAVLRNRILMLIVALDLLALSVGLIDPRLILPQVCYFGLAFVGFGWSAFRAYRDLSLAYRNILAIQPVAKTPCSELSVSFHMGNEYVYSINDPYAEHARAITRKQKSRGVRLRYDARGILYINDKLYYEMSAASLAIRVRMENTGDLPLEVLAVRLENNLNLNYLNITHEEIFLNGKELSVPCALQPREFALLEARYQIAPSKGASNELYAADFQALPRAILHEFTFETRAANGKEQTYTAKLETISQALIDLYVKQWQEFEQEEYLLLAGYHPALAPRES